ncbi:uncharacterized protein LOC131246848 isoform X1 [Magnolia sinica]|uniref:uncharacterized protein LOC131246848 isoform X1 n=1 Tax=Magnolia sinica TaxID=86752 RepID=UPI00265AFF9C|nr:uncharacterized protein LOC131246848 isoform X1 [Magnolia sinica]
MIQLLFLVLFAEGVVALLLMVKIGPLRELMVRGLDQLKIGKGPATVKTLACTMSLIFASSVTSILKIQNRGVKLGTLTPMDQVLWRTHLLEASLIGYSLFLGFTIDRLHLYLRKLTGLRMSVRASKQEIEKLRKEHLHLKEKEERASNDAKLLQEEVSSIKEKLQKLKVEAEEKEKQVASAEAHVVALQKQSEDLLLEYDRLLEDNQILQSQALGFQDLR